MRRFASATTATVTLFALCLASAAPAGATAPGKNGRIAFRRWLDAAHTRAAIFTMSPNGTHVQQLTHPPRRIVTDCVDWSPTGRWLAYCRSSYPDFQAEMPPEAVPFHIFRMRPNGTHRKDLSTDVCDPETCAGDLLPSWSPDGDRIAFSRIYQPTAPGFPSVGISVMNADGSQYQQITEASIDHEDVGPNWSPDGNRLVFVRYVEGGCGCPQADLHAIFIARVDPLRVRRLTAWRLNGSLNPDWSPDGRWILFATVDPAPRGRNLWLVHPNGNGLRRITRDPDDIFSYGKSTFSPDGTMIITSRSPGVGDAGNADVYVMNLDGTHFRNLTRSVKWDSAPDWGPSKDMGGGLVGAVSRESLLPEP
jgi:TolB protein